MAGNDIDPVSFRPQVLREYALVADGARGGLIGPHGDLTWMCAPRWDFDAVFSALIGGAGIYAITPADPWHVWGGYYERGSLIWRSRWVATDTVIECREALAFPGDQDRIVLGTDFPNIPYDYSEQLAAIASWAAADDRLGEPFLRRVLHDTPAALLGV